MPSKNKTRGNTLEYEVRDKAIAKGLVAERAWGSNGRAIGEAETVDVVVAGCRVQCKRRKKLPAFLQIPEGADIVVFREDRGKTFALLDYDQFLDKIKETNGW
jgi:hypothetical protein